MKYAVFFLLFAAAVFAGGDSTNSGVTEPCLVTSDTSFVFSAELVSILDSLKTTNRRWPITFQFHGEKRMKIYYDREKMIFLVVKNFISVPPQRKEENKEEIVAIDPSTGKLVTLERQ